jgi:hypothetical protein
MTDHPAPAEDRGPPLQPLALLSTLSEHGVEFIVIGGFSLAAHGHIRATKDIDVVPAPAPENLARLADALADLGAEVIGVEEFAPEELPFRADVEGLSQGGNWVLRTRLGRLDVMQEIAGVKGYEQLRDGAVELDVPGLDATVLASGLDDVIAMKRAAGREQDMIDIADLERARGSGD